MTKHKQLLPFEPKGLILEDRQPEHWVMGAATGITGQPLLPTANWTPFLPKGEVQKNDYVETYDCTGFGYTNRIEILWKKVFGTERNFSDRGVGIVAGTKPPGNSPQVVAEAVRKSGLLDEADLPFDDSIRTVEQFYSPSPLPTDLLKKALSFLTTVVPLHDWVPTDLVSLKEALKFSPLMVTVTAWYRDDRGLYYFPDGMPNNHDTTLIHIEEDGTFVIFDSYPDENGSYIKRLRSDCKFGQSKRYSFGPGQTLKVSIIQKWIDFLIQLFVITPPDVQPNYKLQPVPPVPAPQPTPEPVSKTAIWAIETWAKAIQSREGFFSPGQNPNYPNGTRSWHNNNPGNFRFNDFVKTSLGAISKDGDGYAIFGSYNEGFGALTKFLIMCCQNQVKGYHDVTLYQFFERYAPANDNNEPDSYANEVARKVGVPVNTPIKQLLS
jgi:hypothetical protein